MSGARRPIIFISYSHKDEPEKPGKSETEWLTFVVGFLRAAFPDNGATIWLDRLMPGGADWNAEIERRLRECDIFVLPISRHSMTSRYVVNKEIAVIREQQAKGEKVHFYAILLKPTPKAALKIVGGGLPVRLRRKMSYVTQPALRGSGLEPRAAAPAVS